MLLHHLSNSQHNKSNSESPGLDPSPAHPASAHWPILSSSLRRPAHSGPLLPATLTTARSAGSSTESWLFRFFWTNGIACYMLDLILWIFLNLGLSPLFSQFFINKFAQNQGHVQIDLGYLFLWNQIKLFLLHRTSDKRHLFMVVFVWLPDRKKKNWVPAPLFANSVTSAKLQRFSQRPYV